MAEHVGTAPRTHESRDIISLAQPRPGQARRSNEYIETPLRPPTVPPEIPKAAKPVRPAVKTERSNVQGPGSLVSSSPTVHSRSSTRALVGLNPVRALITPSVIGTAQPAVTSQPTTFQKDKSNESTDDGHGDSIICRQCGRCKCEDCRTPRPLPSKWICNDKFLCSAPAMVDYCSCLCCAKGLFYHLTKDYEMDNDVSCADQPCTCAPHKRCLRWSCLGLLSLVLPCLCCYWPMRGCVRLCEMGYAGVTCRGCHCNRTDKAPEKRLLDSNSDC